MKVGSGLATSFLMAFCILYIGFALRDVGMYSSSLRFACEWNGTNLKFFCAQYCSLRV